jgi:hypothetical protein
MGTSRPGQEPVDPERAGLRRLTFDGDLARPRQGRTRRLAGLAGSVAGTGGALHLGISSAVAVNLCLVTATHRDSYPAQRASYETMAALLSFVLQAKIARRSPGPRSAYPCANVANRSNNPAGIA